jgi:ABC-type amino acid transport substrate-binding protein
MKRTTQTGFTFSSPYLLNGLMFAGIPEAVACADNQDLSGEGCEDVKICVVDGSTHISIVQNLIPGASIVTAPTVASFYQNFRDGACSVLAGEQFDVAEQTVKNKGYIGNYQLGSIVYSKEPIAFVTRSDDPEFSDFVNWILHGLFAAEETGVTMDAAKFSNLPSGAVFGEAYRYMFLDAVSAVGNFGEIYERHLEPLVPRSPGNMINVGGSPLMSAYPFGSLESGDDTQPPTAGGTIDEIKKRGFLACGVTRAAIFAEFNSTTRTYSGLDVSFCNALSAAIFDGVYDNVHFVLTTPSDRFAALSRRNVDVLSRVTTITFERDVQEPSIGKGVTFSLPTFHDEIRFSGVPP